MHYCTVHALPVHLGAHSRVLYFHFSSQRMRIDKFIYIDGMVDSSFSIPLILYEFIISFWCGRRNIHSTVQDK